MNTPSAIAYTHTFDDKGNITSKRIAAYYYLPDGCTSYLDVPIGGTFDIEYADSGERVTFEVTWRKMDKVDKEPCRYYREVVKT